MWTIVHIFFDLSLWTIVHIFFDLSLWTIVHTCFKTVNDSSFSQGVDICPHLFDSLPNHTLFFSFDGPFPFTLPDTGHKLQGKTEDAVVLGSTNGVFNYNCESHFIHHAHHSRTVKAAVSQAAGTSILIKCFLLFPLSCLLASQTPCSAEYAASHLYIMGTVIVTRTMLNKASKKQPVLDSEFDRLKALSAKTITALDDQVDSIQP